MHEHLAVVSFLDEVVQHLLGDFEVSDDAVFHRLNGDDVARRAAKHLFRFFAHGFDFASVLIDGNDGRLVDDDTFSLRINKGVRRSKIDREIAGEHAEEGAEVREACCAGMKTVIRHSDSSSLYLY